jgi:predicted esterase
MENKIAGVSLLFLLLFSVSHAQVDTSYVFNNSTPYGSMDIRIAKSPSNYYYLQEDKTFSFRESAPGVRTGTYLDMTAWESEAYRQGNLREKTDAGDNFVMNYRFLVPQGYSASYAKGYPITIVMHGYGERGNCENELCYHGDRTWSPLTNTPPAPTAVDFELMNNDHNLLHGAREHLSAVNRAGSKLPNDATLGTKDFPGFVLFPQNLNGWDHFAVQDAIRILRLMIKKYNIDENRVYIQGISNGGHGMYEALKRAPWLFAAAIGMSAIDDGFINVQGVAPSIAHIPLWIFQGGKDINPSPNKTRRYIQQFRSAGADVRFTLYPELAHGTWNTAMREPDYFSWLLGKDKSDIHSFENSKVICSAEGTKLEVGTGFKAYQWQFNGQIIPEATSSVYYATKAGTYKARFSRVSNPTESQWNPWSDAVALTVENPPTATISQIGTVVLKDLNGGANAQLQSATNHAHYYWYKNGTLVDLPGREDDTLKVATLTPAYGNGVYTLVVSDFACKSAPSPAKYVFFNNSAPVNITAPSNLSGTSASASEVSLTWTDASANEIGFEIWRRRQNGNGALPWELAGLTGPNIKTYNDTALAPLSSYQYKIRAVGIAGRSDYFPAAANEYVTVQTVVDTERPTAPTDLKVVVKGVQTLQLTWMPSRDNSRIRQYYLYLNGDSIATGTADTAYRVTNARLNQLLDVRVKAVDLSGNMSAPSKTVKVNTYVTGLFYEHSTGSWTDLDSIDWTLVEFSGRVNDFTLSPRTQDDYYNFRFDGFVYIESGGSYQFRTSSNDGSRLMLDNAVLVDNDGVHDIRTVTSAKKNLEEGAHRITAEYFEYTQADTLVVEYKGPDTGNEWAVVAKPVLKSAENVVTAVGPDNGPEDSFVLSVFPNPATQDNINVQIETVLREPVQVRLVDPVGRDLFNAIYEPGEVTNGIRISAPGILTTGIYLVLVEQAGIRAQRKVIIRR